MSAILAQAMLDKCIEMASTTSHSGDLTSNLSGLTSLIDIL